MTAGRGSAIGAAPADGRSLGSATVWPLHLALALGGFVFGTAEFAIMGVLPLIGRDFAIPLPVASHAVSAYALGVMVGAPTLALIGAKASRRVMLLALLGTFAVANFLSGMAPDWAALLVLRFIAGLPHGAFFGTAALVAAHAVAPERRAEAVGRVMTGLTVATIVGVPLATVLAERAGWRLAYGAIGGLAALSALAVAVRVPHDPPRAQTALLAELGALRDPHVVMTLLIGAIGFGGMFAIYTYLAPTLAAVTHAPGGAVPVTFALFGVGMTLGNLIVPRLFARHSMRGIGAALAWSVVAAVGYVLAAGQLWSVLIAVIAVGAGGALGALLQTRLMDVAGEAQSLTAALNHAAFNAANAIGPWLGGVAIAAGWGWTSTGWIAAGLASAGLILWAAATRVEEY